MLVSLVLLALAAAGQETDTLAPAREGKIRCIAPDARARTCATMVRYSVRDDGRFDALVTGVVSAEPLIVIEYRTSGQIEEGAVCSMVRPADFTAGKLSKDGAPLAPGVENDVRAKVMAALQPLAGRKRCYRDRVDGEGVFSDVTINGALRPELGQRAVWVKPEDGYAPGM